MATKRNRGAIQPYPREKFSRLADSALFPVLTPKLSKQSVQMAIREAFSRVKKTKRGDDAQIAHTPQQLVELCLTHLKERSDPILGPSFNTQLDIEDVFSMDAVSHEMQRQRMRIGMFYQYLILELMKAASRLPESNILKAFDGAKEGDVVADVRTPGFNKNLRLYLSVKKSSDTVGGQDVWGMIRKLESVAVSDKNLTSPYLCVVAIATPHGGKIQKYEDGRSLRYDQDGRPYSENCEIWTPGFIYPYITGWSAKDLYEVALSIVEQELPFYSIKFKKECTALLKKKFTELGIVDSKRNVVKRHEFFEYILQ